MAPQEIFSKRGKITPQDLAAMADLCAKGLNETEACHILGIKDRTWFQWKQRHVKQFEAVFETVRAEKILASLNNIEQAAKKDWRAAERLLKWNAPERFGDKKELETVMVPVISENLLLSALKKVYGEKSTLDAIGDNADVITLSESPNKRNRQIQRA